MNRMTTLRIHVCAVLSAMAFAPLGAQAPTVTVAKVSPVRSLAHWPGLTLVADQDAYSVVVAVTRGANQTAVQLLSPVEPTRATAIRKGKRLPVRSLRAQELTHLMSYSSSPLILAFASKQKPNLEAFVQQNRWAPDVVLDTAATSIQEIVGVLGREFFGDSAAVTTTVAEAASPRLLSAQANAFTFIENCGRGSTVIWNGEASSVPNGNLSFSGALGVVSYPDWNWGPGTLLSGQSFKILPAQAIGSACIDSRMALFPNPRAPGRPVPAAGAPGAPELKMPAASDKPVEAIPAHMAPGPVVYPPSQKPPR